MGRERDNCHCGGLKSRVSNQCRSCYDQERDANRVTPRETVDHHNYKPITQRNYYLRVRYGLTEEQFTDLLNFQEGRCPICKSTETRGINWNVEHDHTCPKHESEKACIECIRGLTCGYCNSQLIAKIENPLFKAALEYLADPPAKRFFNVDQEVWVLDSESI